MFSELLSLKVKATVIEEVPSTASLSFDYTGLQRQTAATPFVHIRSYGDIVYDSREDDGVSIQGDYNSQSMGWFPAEGEELTVEFDE